MWFVMSYGCMVRFSDCVLCVHCPNVCDCNGCDVCLSVMHCAMLYDVFVMCGCACVSP